MGITTLALTQLSSTGLLFSIVFLAAALFLIQLEWKRYAKGRRVHQLKGPISVPILGSAVHFIGVRQEDYITLAFEWTKEYPSPSKFWAGSQLLVAIYDPEDIQIVLKSNKTIEKDPFYDFFKDTVGEGLFSAPEAKWKQNRKIISPAFNTRLLETFMTIFNEKNRYLVDRLEVEVGKGEFNAAKYIVPMNMDVICRTALGIEVDAQDNPNHEFLQAVDQACHITYSRLFKVWLHPNLMWKIFGPVAELKKVNQRLFEFPLSLIAQRKIEFQERKNNSEAENGAQDDSKVFRNNFIDILLDLNDKGAKFSDGDIRDEVVTMIIGGMETSALTNCFCLVLLGMHPTIQEKVYAEVMEVIGFRDVTMEDCSKLVYLEMVLKETLRVYPVGPALLRRNKDDIQLSTCTVPAQTTIAIVTYRMHHDENIYPDPEKFDPERFTPENVAKRHPFSFIPFSGGPRSCIGSKYAMLSMKVTIANIIRKYKISTSLKNTEDLELKVDLLLKSVNGYPISISKRPVPEDMS